MFYFKDSPFIVKKVKSSKDLFLSFDDGPCPEFTSEILNVLVFFNAKASFFVIGKKAELELSLIKEMKNQGHGVFSHSYDHAYHHFFESELKQENWILHSLQHLEQITEEKQILFRPPAGVLTPPMMTIAKKHNIPMILWTQRFYDSWKSWSAKKALSSARSLNGGEIILLHDEQKKSNQLIFLDTLKKYLHLLTKLGYRFSALNSEVVKNEVQLAQFTQ